MAIYQAIRLTPTNTAIDGTLPATCSFVCKGSTITKYNAKFLRTSDNVQVYTTGDVPLSPVKYDGNTVTFIVPPSTFTNGIEYKWYVDTYEGTSMATSIQIIFKANQTPTVTSTIPATINAQSYTFQFTYTQAQNVPIQYWYLEFKDSFGKIIETTDKFFNGNISYQKGGFISGQNYSVKAYTVNSSGVETSSPIYNFTASYGKPNITIVPTIIQDAITSIVTILWGSAVVVFGAVTGTYAFIQNYGLFGNWALNLSGGSIFTIARTIPEVQSTIISLNPNGFTDGKIATLKGFYGDYEFGYEAVNTRFYFNNKGVFGFSQSVPLPTDDYHIIIRPQNAYVKINDVLYELNIV